MKKLLIGFAIVSSSISSHSCDKETYISPEDNYLSKNYLSEYEIYQGSPQDLIPKPDFRLYELNSQLFSDYSEKQRLIKVPSGFSLEAVDDNQFLFPEGTIIVKTFYYFNDKRAPSLGKKLLETRILEKRDDAWVTGTYKWNDEQTDAKLVTSGVNQTINWINEEGEPVVIAYQIPSTYECRACHSNNQKVVPIGLQPKHLNFEVIRNGSAVNQLSYFSREGVVNPVNPTEFISVPSYYDVSKSIEERSRAYLDINCAHCHSNQGMASNNRYRFKFENDLRNTGIIEGKNSIRVMMGRGAMPLLGTTIIDTVGVDLISEFIELL